VRAFAVLVSVAALGGVAAGCGDDDSSGDDAKPASLAIEASGDSKAPKFKAPASVSGGLVKIEFTNNTKGDDVDGQIIRAEGDHSDEEVVAELGKAVRGKPVADWFVATGGPGGTKPGQTSTATQVLEPGRYYVVGGDDAPKGPPTKFEVEGGGGGELPDADATVTASDYKFEGSGLKAGKSTIELKNEGGQWHHFLGAQLNPGATIEDAKKFFATEKGKPPISEENVGVQSTVMNGGVSQLVDVDLKPGKYVFFCFISDRNGGPPHVKKGMVSEVTVED
jgi:uncharacterized cupredoxin-like copper-binding protein